MYKMSSVTTGPVATNCYTIINDETNEAILIDASGNVDFLLKAVRNAEAEPVALLLTHGHFDHVDAAKDIKKAYPDIKIYIGEKDFKLSESPMLNLSVMFTGRPVSVKADETVVDGEELELIGIRIKCLEISGHTKGGICYYMPDLNAVFDGDTLFHASVGRSDFPGGNGEDLLSGIEQKLFSLPEETRVFPGHDSETTIGWEKKNNPYF